MGDAVNDLLADHEPAITLADQIGCIEREIGYRVRVYPRWVDRGKISQGEADRQLALMRAVNKTLCRLKAKELGY